MIKIKDFCSNLFILLSCYFHRYDLLRTCWASENKSRPTIGFVAHKLSEILEKDETAYSKSTLINQGSHLTHNYASDQLYSTTDLSRV